MIVDTLQSHLVEVQRMQSQLERKTTKASKNRKSPKKPTAARSRTRSRRVQLDSSDLSSSDSDAPLCSSSRAQQARSRPAYDPNTIVLDCDDEFIGGPAVNLNRNVAAASTVCVEESMDLKVTVRIKGKMEQYHMNPVSPFRFAAIYIFDTDFTLNNFWCPIFEQYQKLSVLITQLSEKHNVPSDHIALMFKEKTVSDQETPNSIGYIQGLILSKFDFLIESFACCLQS